MKKEVERALDTASRPSPGWPEDGRVATSESNRELCLGGPGRNFKGTEIYTCQEQPLATKDRHVKLLAVVLQHRIAAIVSASLPNVNIEH